MGLCTAPYKMLLFCVQTSVRGSRSIELARLKTPKEEEEEEEEERKKEKHLAHFASSWFKFGT